MKFSTCGHRRPAAVIAAIASCIVMGACSSAPKEIKALAPPTYAELMASAEAAQQQGRAPDALAAFERAAKAAPASKQPWLRISQAQFDARNYGAAITAAQEVLQRDNTDVTAKSIMAASGLRVSASALEQLRNANALGGSTRDEAQSLARTMREALGESIFPALAPPAPEPAAAKASVHRAPRKPAAVRQAPASPAAAAPAQAPAAAQPKRNPFDALKG